MAEVERRHRVGRLDARRELAAALGVEARRLQLEPELEPEPRHRRRPDEREVVEARRVVLVRAAPERDGDGPPASASGQQTVWKRSGVEPAVPMSKASTRRRRARGAARNSSRDEPTSSPESSASTSARDRARRLAVLRPQPGLRAGSPGCARW